MSIAYANVFVDDAHGTGFSSMFGAPDRSLFEHVANNYNHSNLLGAAARSWVDNAGAMFARVGYEEISRKARAWTRHLTETFRSSDIRPLHTVGSVQTAPESMVRWIMAEPTIRTMYHNGEAEGYDGIYVDHHANLVGEAHYDYRRVMHGVVTPLGGDGWESRQYIEHLWEPEDRLEMDDQHAISIAWDTVKRQLDERVRDEDPTSVWNSTLG